MPEELAGAIIQTWEIHNRIHGYLLAAIPDESLTASMTTRGRTVFDLFAHVHNVRLMWLKAAGPEFLDGLAKIEPKSDGTTGLLAASLAASGAAITSLLSKSLSSDGRIKGFKPHATAFAGYLISHESHHRGQIEWALKISGKPLSDSVSYGIWEWGSR